MEVIKCQFLCFGFILLEKIRKENERIRLFASLIFLLDDFCGMD